LLDEAPGNVFCISWGNLCCISWGNLCCISWGGVVVHGAKGATGHQDCSKGEEQKLTDVQDGPFSSAYSSVLEPGTH
jgi:hypothetical protein